MTDVISIVLLAEEAVTDTIIIVPEVFMARVAVLLVVLIETGVELSVYITAVGDISEVGPSMIMLLNMSYSEGDMTGFSVVGRKYKVVISLPNITVYIVLLLIEATHMHN